MAMKNLTNRMILVANLSAGRTVTGQDKAFMRLDRFSAHLSYPRCLEGLTGHEPQYRDIVLVDGQNAIRAGRLGGPRLSWPRATRLWASRPAVAKRVADRAA